MWVVIEANANYTLRGRTVETAGVLVGYLLAAAAPDGSLLFAQFISGYSAEQIEDGW